jgi:hypothetical protein
MAGVARWEKPASPTAVLAGIDVPERWLLDQEMKKMKAHLKALPKFSEDQDIDRALEHYVPEASLPTILLKSEDVEEQTQHVEYESLPPKRSFTVSVRYKIRGQAEPLDYPMND